MNLSKKLIAIGATVSVVFMSFGGALGASATTIADGDLVISPDSSAVYYIQGSYKRVFPHANVYYSWGYPDFSTVKTVSASELAAYEDANPMPFRDSSLFRGTASSLHGKDQTAVFYVEDSKLRPVKSSDIYQALFNDADWSKVTWVPDDMLSKFDYELGSDLESSSSHPDGSLVQYEGEDQVYLVENGNKRAISDAAFEANRYKEGNVVTIDSGEVYSNGSAITGVESGLLTPGWKGVSESTGLTVSLDSSNPSSAVVPYGATNVAVLAVKLQAGGSDVTVDSLEFKRSDLGNTSDWDSMYLYEGSTRLTASGRSISSDSHTVEFPALSLSISANSSKVIELRGDLNNSSGISSNRHVFKLETVETTAEVTGLPLTGNVVTAGGVQVGSVEISQGTAPVNPSVGASDVEVSTFDIRADGSNDVSFQQIVLTYSGNTSRSDITNLKLSEVTEDTTLASVSSIASDDTVTFTLDSPMTIAEGNTKNFQVKADLGGEASETLKFYLDSTNHLTAMDTDYDFGARINQPADSTDYDSTDVSSLTLQGGEVSIADNGPAVDDVVNNQNDLVLNEFSMTAERDVEVRRLKVTLTCSGNYDGTGADEIADGDISDLRVKDTDTGSTLMSASITACASAGTAYTLTDTFNLNAGVTKNMAVTVDIGSDSDGNLADTTIKAKAEMVANGSNYYVRDVATGNYLSDIVPTSVSGKNQTIIDSSVTLAAASRPTSESYVIGTEDVETLGVLLSAGDASDINVRQIKARVYLDEDGTKVDPSNAISKVALYHGDTMLGEESITYSSTYGTVTFSSLNVDITAGQDEKFVFKVDMLDTYSPSTSKFWVAVPAANVTAYDSNNDSKSPSTNINVTTSASSADPKVTVLSSGSLAVTANADTPNSDYIVARDTNVEVGKFDFAASNEDITVNTLTVDIDNTTSTRSLDGNVTITYDGNPPKTASMNSSTGRAKFTDLGWVVDKDMVESLTVAVDVATMLSGGTNAGDQIKIGLYHDGSGSDDFKALSTSGTTLTESDVAVSTASGNMNTMYVVKSVPTVTKATLDDTLTNGTEKLYKFTVNANDNGKVAVKEFTFDVALTDAGTGSALSVDSYQIYDASDESDPLNNSAVTDDTPTNGGTIEIELDSEEVITAGSSKSFILKATVANALADDSVVTELVNTADTSFDNGDFDGSGSDDLTTPNFVWSDYSAGETSHGTGTTDWYNGYKVNNFPLDPLSISK